MSDDTRHFSQAESQVREEIIRSLGDAVDNPATVSTLPIEYPPDSALGDFGVPCFTLSKTLKQSPNQIANDLAQKIKPTRLITKVQAAGAYLNFFVNRAAFNQLVFEEMAHAKDRYGAATIGRGTKVMIEYFGPNTNKPLTVGHLRNISLGYSVSQLLKFLGHKVLDTTIYNDRGIAIAKTILAYQRWGKNQTPKTAKMKPDHFVGSFYVRFGQELLRDKKLEQDVQEVLRQWEAGDKTISTVAKKLIGWADEGYQRTLKKFGVPKFAKEYREHEYYRGGKKLVEQGVQKGIFKKHPEGYVYADLESSGLPNKILLRSDGTSLYITQDLYLAYLKSKEKINQSVVVSAVEQDLHFKQLFKIIEQLGIAKAEDNHHLSYGMVRLPDGKIKSREGLVKGTGADDLIAQLEEMARAEVTKRFPDLKVKEVEKRAELIALGALKYFILAVDASKNMIFDPQQSLQFVGKTGPYIQYMSARINSIFGKTKVKKITAVDYSLLQEDETFALVKLLARFPAVVSEAGLGYNPAHLANYLYELAKAFSVFYETMPVAKAPTTIQSARVMLLREVQSVLQRGLSLLGITAPQKM